MEVTINAPGDFSVQNALAATACLPGGGLRPRRDRSRASRTWAGAPGSDGTGRRGPAVQSRGGLRALRRTRLQRVLGMLREESRGRLIAVFGCIGERERDRRSAMGAVAAAGADFTIVTDDNPYTEDRDAIIAEIVAGLEASGKRAGHDFAVIPDRREAIAHALAMAVDEDTVLLAGKGHETAVHLPERFMTATTGRSPGP